MNEQTEDIELVFADLNLLDKIISALAAISCIISTRHTDSQLSSMLNRPYLSSLRKEITEMEQEAGMAWAKRGLVMEKLGLINNFYSYIESHKIPGIINDYQFVVDAFNRYKEQYIS